MLFYKPSNNQPCELSSEYSHNLKLSTHTNNTITLRVCLSHNFWIPCTQSKTWHIKSLIYWLDEKTKPLGKAPTYAFRNIHVPGWDGTLISIVVTCSHVLCLWFLWALMWNSSFHCYMTLFGTGHCQDWALVSHVLSVKASAPKWSWTSQNSPVCDIFVEECSENLSWMKWGYDYSKDWLRRKILV